jgi:hypothetical protein
MAAVIRPGEEVFKDSARGGLRRRNPPQFVTFQDADGQFWIRDLPTGQLAQLRNERIDRGSLLAKYLARRQKRRSFRRLRQWMTPIARSET